MKTLTPERRVTSAYCLPNTRAKSRPSGCCNPTICRIVSGASPKDGTIFVSLTLRGLRGKGYLRVKGAADPEELLVLQSGMGIFPVTPVEATDFMRDIVMLIDAMPMYTPAVRVRSGLVEALYPAARAKQMLGAARAETVRRQCFRPAQQLEVRMRHEEVQEARHAANRTVAGEQLGRRLDLRRKADGSAVTAALDPHYSTVTDFARLRG